MNENLKKAYPFSGMFVTTLLLVFGFFMLYYTGMFEIGSFKELGTYLYKHCFEFIVSFVFIVSSIYIWVSYFKDAYIVPKTDIFYLKSFDEDTNEYEFVDKKGKCYFITHKEKLDVDSFYEVLRSANIIYEIIDESDQKFKLKKGKNYWLNLYSPVGIYENMLILPALYVIIIPGILSVFMSVGFYKLFGLIWVFIPIYFIVYDYLYKLKLKDDKLNKKEQKEIENMNKSFFSLVNMLKLCCAIIPLIVMILIYNDFNDKLGRLIFTPIVVLGVCVVGYVVCEIIHKDKIKRFFEKGYVLVFLIYWFGTLSYFTIKTIIQQESFILILATIPFWLAGVAFTYYNMTKDEK